MFASVFAFQLYKENEDFAKRLGRAEPQQNLKFSEYLSTLQNKLAALYKETYPKIRYYTDGVDKLIRLLPIKIKIK